MRENITLNREEQKRLHILNQVVEGKLVARQAAELMNRSVRQIRRMVAAYRKRGAAAVVHGNRDRRPVNRIPKRVVNQVVKLARGRYAGFNQQHFSEMLASEKESRCRELRCDAFWGVSAFGVRVNVGYHRIVRVDSDTCRKACWYRSTVVLMRGWDRNERS